MSEDFKTHLVSDQNLNLLQRDQCGHMLGGISTRIKSKIKSDCNTAIKAVLCIKPFNSKDKIMLIHLEPAQGR